MKITFPHMGNSYISAKTFLDEFNVDYIIPSYNNKKALETGSKYAPELACLPLKINLGNYIEAYEKGADTVLITGGCGPCRFGYYGELEKEILRDLGMNLEFIILEKPEGDFRELIRRLRKLTGSVNPLRLINAFAKTGKIAKKVDELELLKFKIASREITQGLAETIYNEFRTKAYETKGYCNLEKLISNTTQRLLNIPVDKEKEVLKIGIVGEIFTTIDPFANHNIDVKLSRLGAEAHRVVSVSGWIIEHMIKKGLHLPRNIDFEKEAEPYLGTMIGGHAQETLGNAIIYSKNNYDGIIQIYPLSCMPEIVAQSILPKIEKDFDIPVLTLIIDEMTGQEGYQTRIEAFVDLLRKRKEGKSVYGEAILSRN